MKKWWLLFFLVIGISIGVFVLYPKTEKSPQYPIRLEDYQSYYFSVPIVEFASGDIPCLMIQIEDKNIKVELDLGYRGTAVFPKEMIKKIREKTLIGERTMYGIRGKSYQHLRYTAPTIRIGKLNISNFIMEEEQEEFLHDSKIGKVRQSKTENLGRLGWQLFRKCNLFLDLASSKIAFCDSAKTLEKQGYPMDKFMKFPLRTERGLIEIAVDGFDGTQEIWVLDTGCTWNFANAKDHIKSAEEMLVETDNQIERSLKVGNIDLGRIVFHKIPIPLPIHVDAILGMEFLKKHQVFIDFTEKQLYLSKIKKSGIPKTLDF